MPPTRSSSAKSRKSKASKSLSTSGPSPGKSSSSNSSRRFPCCAWWCDSTFSRRADMLKHVDGEHFGKRSYCTICLAVMKQDSNMSTHLNAHLSNYCTVCSCGRRFTDPSVYTKHRENLRHTRGPTHGRVRPTPVKGVRIQHLAGVGLTFEEIADPSFIPPAFDTSYHFQGRPKPRGREEYRSSQYVELTESTAVPSVQTAEPQGSGGALDGTEHLAPAQNEVQVEEREVHYNQISDPNVHAECHRSPITYPGAVPSYPITSGYPTDHWQYPDQLQENYPVMTHNNLPPPPQPLAGSHFQPESRETLYLPPAPHPFHMTSQRFFVEDVESSMHVQYPPQADFYDQVYNPALDALATY